MSLLDGLDTGCRCFTDGKADVGGVYWRKAFREIETLVQGTYHSIIPNIIFKVNDLEDSGYRDAAKMLKKHPAQYFLAHQSPNGASAAIFRALADADMDQMKELETLIMTCFLRLFELYLGPRCYSTFVMKMDLARRRILRGEPLDRCLPVLSDLDALFGQVNHRSLDAIRLRMETLFHRKEYAKVEEQAMILTERSSTIEGDAWRRFYFLVKGGLLSCCLEWEAELWKIDNTGQFDSEKVEILDRLEAMALRTGQVDDAANFSSRRLQILERIQSSELD